MTDIKKTAYVFPGQGSQIVGMCKDLYDNFDSVKGLFKQADDAIGFALTKLIFEGPDEELKKTVNAQPALVTAGIACLTAAQEVVGVGLIPATFMAGHSLGEYTAMAAAGVVDFATAVHLSHERGRLMFDSGLKQPGTMAAVLGLDEAVLAEVCRDTQTVIANVNCPGQFVISGSIENISRAAELAKTKGASRVIPLQVSGAFHSPLMQPAVEGMSSILANIGFKNPSVPIIGNVNARPLIEGIQFKDELLMQLTSAVQWHRSVEYMLANEIKTCIEFGPGKVLTGLIKRINKEIEIINLSDAASMKAINT